MPFTTLFFDPGGVLLSKRRQTSGNEMNIYADDLSELIETPDLKGAVLIGFSAGGGEVDRNIGRHVTRRVVKAACYPIQRETC
jgi:pimeloyl-ACP methyl ester carboxylesterase